MTDRRFYEQQLLVPENRALLEVLKRAEGTSKYKDPYRVGFGGAYIGDLSRHPRITYSPRNSDYESAAAGAYQFMPRTWDEVASKLGLSQFGPREQDIAALYKIRQRLGPLGGLAAVQKQGLSREVLAALAPEWASLPTMAGTSAYGQPVKRANDLQAFYANTLNRYTSPQQQRPAATSSTGATSSTAASPKQAQVPKGNEIYNLINGLIQRSVGMFNPQKRSSTVDPAEAYFDQALALDASGDTAGAAKYYEAALNAEPPASKGGDELKETFGALMANAVNDYLDVVSTQQSAAPASSPAAPPSVSAPTPANRNAQMQQTEGYLGLTDFLKQLQAKGLTVKEHPAFGRVGKHSDRSWHYEGLAADITDWNSGNWKGRTQALGQLKRQLLGDQAEIFHPGYDPVGGHGTHLHFALPSGRIPVSTANKLLQGWEEIKRRYPST